ncbi:hypothetical protein GGI26_001490 [Coemansia sp. RSA 1358]|uniref:Uncharacterized protein n=1 Tax=Coemansia umbellata TaxID=1424467 RepID=A0ABQ8PUC3_9FUNG|nr:hypothetical protein BX070DRAFT_229179 [Coemansia spiralis]KAJ1994550.1 hypothetical protein EDC05_001466 [Coemansia umbellata]KAJ2624356.1 hypothetical protein GGI26_001490 [Coemansia sp. RSA 1358]
MSTIIAAATVVVAAFNAASAYPIYNHYSGYGGAAQSSYHNSGAYDDGATTSVSPYGSTSNSWNNGFSASQNNAATPYGNAGSSSFNQWNNNAWSNNYYGYPRYYY